MCLTVCLTVWLQCVLQGVFQFALQCVLQCVLLCVLQCVYLVCLLVCLRVCLTVCHVFGYNSDMCIIVNYIQVEWGGGHRAHPKIPLPSRIKEFFLKRYEVNTYLDIM